jgi:hypothetical protein
VKMTRHLLSVDSPAQCSEVEDLRRKEKASKVANTLSINQQGLCDCIWQTQPCCLSCGNIVCRVYVESCYPRSPVKSPTPFLTPQSSNNTHLPLHFVSITRLAPSDTSLGASNSDLRLPSRRSGSPLLAVAQQDMTQPSPREACTRGEAMHPFHSPPAYHGGC